MAEIRKNSLIGLWILVKYLVRFEQDGREVYPFGEDAKGYIYYSPEGFTAGVMMRNDRPNFTTGDRLGATEAEKVKAWDSYITYMGFYELEEEEQRVIHKIRLSLYPNWSGQDQYRYIQYLKNGNIELTNYIEERGVRRVAVATWRRATPEDYE
jgi:hypothetical protein